MKHILTILFSLLGFTTAAAQEIPQYDVVEVTPASGTTVSALTTISVSLQREGYDAPIGIMPGAAAVEAVRLDGTTETPIAAPKATVDKTNGNLLVSFAEPYNTPGTVVVRIPAGLTNNLAMPVATMTTEEIIAEGGCTNPALTLTFNVETALLPVKDVTGIGHDTYYVQDEDGNFVKDENGQYIRVDQYDTLIDAQLEPTKGDRVTVLYFWYDEKFASINYTGGASVTNISNGTSVGIANVGFKSGGDSHRNDVIELRLSTADYIQSEEFHQGIYEVVLPEGIATTADGRISGGKTFRFTFGDPAKAYVPEKIDLDAYLGDYKAVSEDGEDSPSEESFTLVKDGEDYFVTNLCGYSLRIPVKPNGSNLELEMTEAESGEAFMSSRNGGNVTMLVSENEGKRYIYLDQYAIFNAADVLLFVGGIIYFEQQPKAIPDGISSVTSEEGKADVYDLAGRRVVKLQKGVGISQGRKVLK